MATKNADCCTCETPTRRRCKDCKQPVCSECHTHGQCENCVDGRTFAFTDYSADYPPSHSFTYHGRLPEGYVA